MRGGENRLVRVSRSNAVAPLHLVGVRAGLACQHAGVGAKSDDLVPQPAASNSSSSASAAETAPAVNRRLRVYGGGQLRGAK